MQIPAEKLGKIYQADIAHITDFEPRYNVAPAQKVPVLFGHADERMFELVRFGMTPKWWKQKSRQLINLRRDTLQEKPFFRRQLEHSRCILPVTGFFEWQAQKDGPKTPFRFAPQKNETFSLGCIWETDEIDGEPVQSFAIITTAPNELIKPIHDRMPLIIEDDGLETWLNPDTELKDLLNIMSVYPKNKMRAYEVSRAINNPANDTPDVAEPAN